MTHEPELAGMRVILEVVAPLEPLQRARVLAAAASMCGHYEIAIEILRWAQREQEEA